MDLGVFIKGVMIGLVLCAPMGPIGVLSVRRSLVGGRWAGFLSVLGASVVDGLYCILAGLGVTYISDLVMQQERLIEFFGGLILILIGIKIFFSRPVEKRLQPETGGLVRAFTSTFFVTLANPFPLLVFAAAFTALGVHGWKADYMRTAILVAGVFAGSAAWGPVLAAGVGFFRPFMNSSHIGMVNKVSGTILLGFGAVLLISLLIP